ncbi:hypothetical protein L1987_04537 [Smallanthus sonchifolius]|uniref:Uncharacterized protein n=1 Tax=Smallanthus sonchifolius TaxID=185202 RepID=A0ACB9JSV7_9ASTR|nr:hypothetical protein L1987_04537 [Smallanthus sonchifolius]
MRRNNFKARRQKWKWNRGFSDESSRNENPNSGLLSSNRRIEPFANIATLTSSFSWNGRGKGTNSLISPAPLNPSRVLSLNPNTSKVRKFPISSRFDHICSAKTFDYMILFLRMAFHSRIGSLMRQTRVSNGQVTGPSMFNAIRCMSSKLFVGGLSYQTDDYSLKEAFSGFGDVIEARVITDRESGRSRGFGFVNYTSDDSANEAMKAMDGQELNGRNIRVSLATERAPRTSGFDGGYNSRSGDARNDRY